MALAASGLARKRARPSHRFALKSVFSLKRSNKLTSPLCGGPPSFRSLVAHENPATPVRGWTGLRPANTNILCFAAFFFIPLIAFEHSVGNYWKRGNFLQFLPILVKINSFGGIKGVFPPDSHQNQQFGGIKARYSPGLGLDDVKIILSIRRLIAVCPGQRATFSGFA